MVCLWRTGSVNRPTSSPLSATQTLAHAAQRSRSIAELNRRFTTKLSMIGRRPLRTLPSRSPRRRKDRGGRGDPQEPSVKFLKINPADLSLATELPSGSFLQAPLTARSAKSGLFSPQNAPLARLLKRGRHGSKKRVNATVRPVPPRLSRQRSPTAFNR
jgi:hypothetical protein